MSLTVKTAKLSCLAALMAITAGPLFADKSKGCEASKGKASKCDALEGLWYNGIDGVIFDAVALNSVSADQAADPRTQTATTSFVTDAYLRVRSSGVSGAQVLDVSADDTGNLSSPSITRQFTVSANSDHNVSITFDAIQDDGKCLPIFDAEGGGEGVIAGEADAIVGYMKLSVGGTELWNADSKAMADPTNSILENSPVTITCNITGGTKGIATAVVETDVRSVISMTYTLEVGAYGRDGAIIFSGGEAESSGDAPAGAYDNDVLISVGLTKGVSTTTVDQYAGNSFGGS